MQNPRPCVKSEFIIQPILFNSLMISSLRSLSEIGEIIGEDTSEINAWIHKTENAINTKLWNKEKSLYCDYDFKNDRLIVKDTIANYSPLFTGIVPSDRINLLLKNLFSTKKYIPKNGYPFCSVSMHEDDFDPVFSTLIPMDTWCPILQMMIFYDKGKDEGVQCINVSGTNTFDLYDRPYEGQCPEEQWPLLRKIVEERDPKRIGINIGSVQWAAGGLTHNLYTQLVEVLPPRQANSFA